MPLGQGSGSSLFENIAAVEMALVVEMAVDRSMDGGEFLQGLDVSERHCQTNWPGAEEAIIEDSQAAS